MHVQTAAVASLCLIYLATDTKSRQGLPRILLSTVLQRCWNREFVLTRVQKRSDVQPLQCYSMISHVCPGVPGAGELRRLAACPQAASSGAKDKALGLEAFLAWAKGTPPHPGRGSRTIIAMAETHVATRWFSFFGATLRHSLVCCAAARWGRSRSSQFQCMLRSVFVSRASMAAVISSQGDDVE